MVSIRVKLWRDIKLVYIFVYACLCMSVHTWALVRVCFCLFAQTCECRVVWQLAEAFFQCTRLGEPPLQLWLMRSCCWPCRGQSTGTHWGWCLFVVRNRLGQGAPVIKHLNPHKHSSGSDFLLRMTHQVLFYSWLEYTELNPFWGHIFNFCYFHQWVYTVCEIFKFTHQRNFI